MKEKFICKKPGKKSFAIIRRDKKVISPSMTREFDFVWEKSKGAYVWDIEGKKYLDFASAVAVANVGHTNPDVVKAIQRQLKKGLHAGFPDFYNELPVKFAETLLKFVPKHLNKVFLSNSGTESVEAAIKLARWYTKKSGLVAFSPSFHGRTMGSLSLTDALPVQKEGQGPFLDVKHSPYPYCYRCPFGKQHEHDSKECVNDYLYELEKAVRACKGAAAIFFEPISGEPGYIVPPREFVKGVREIADKYNSLLCIDEVQSGCYRTGKFLAIENFSVKADIVSLSKAIGGGVPLGATLASSKIMSWPPGAHANTFGGNLLACSGGIATLNYMKKRNLGENAKRLGNHIKKRLEEMKEKYEMIGDVRGIGLMIGVEFVKSKRGKEPAVQERKKILCKASEKGLLLLPAGESTIRISPPLILTRAEADSGLDILEDSIMAVSR